MWLESLWTKERAQSYLVPTIFCTNAQHLFEHCAHYRLPAMYWRSELAELGLAALAHCFERFDALVSTRSRPQR